MAGDQAAFHFLRPFLDAGHADKLAAHLAALGFTPKGGLGVAQQADQFPAQPAPGHGVDRGVDRLVRNAKARSLRQSRLLALAPARYLLRRPAKADKARHFAEKRPVRGQPGLAPGQRPLPAARDAAAPASYVSLPPFRFTSSEPCPASGLVPARYAGRPSRRPGRGLSRSDPPLSMRVLEFPCRHPNPSGRQGVFVTELESAKPLIAAGFGNYNIAHLRPVYLGDVLFASHPVVDAMNRVGGSLIPICKESIQRTTRSTSTAQRRRSTVGPSSNAATHDRPLSLVGRLGAAGY